MFVKQIINSLFSSNTWVLEVSSHFWLVDCGDTERALEMSGERAIAGVLLTHGHFDHIYGLNHLLERYPDVPIYCNSACREALTDDKANMSRYHEQSFVLDHPENIHLVDEGDSIPLYEGLTAQVFATPGHHASCVSFRIGDYFFTGDSFIPDTKIVTILPGGDKRLAAQSVQRILQLAQDRTICPGHGNAIHTPITS